MIKLHHVWQLHISIFLCMLTFADKLYRVIIAYISGLIKYKIILSFPICTLATTGSWYTVLKKASIRTFSYLKFHDTDIVFITCTILWYCPEIY